MIARPRVHDRAILDALEALGTSEFEGSVWRVVRQGREPLRGSSAHGRWSSNGEFEVLYTSLEKAGALAEVGYRLSLEPIWPSLIEHEVHRIEARAHRTLHLPSLESLVPLGVDIAKYEGLDYAATQSIAAAAYFLECDSLLVPSARFPTSNLVIFLERILTDGGLELGESEAVDWSTWQRANPRVRTKR